MSRRVCVVSGCGTLVDAGARGGRCTEHRAAARRARGNPPDNGHRKARARMLPAAIGQPCPVCGEPMRADAVDLDHEHPRALGGTGPGTRIICSRCNRSRGGRLSRRLASDR